MHSLHSATACGGTGAITPLAGVGAGLIMDRAGVGTAGMAVGIPVGTVVGMLAGAAGTAAGAGLTTTIPITIRAGIIREVDTGVRVIRIPRGGHTPRVMCLHHPEYLRVQLQFVAVRLLVLQRVNVLLSRPDVQLVLLPDVW